MAFSAKWLESCGKAIAGRLPEAPTGNHNGRCILDLVSVARPRSRGGTQPPSRRHARAQQPPRLLAREKLRPATGPLIPNRKKLRLAQRSISLTREKTRPARGFHRHFREKVRPATGPLIPNREKVRPARHKTPISGHFEHAGRTFSRSRPPSDHAGRTFSRTGRSTRQL